MAAVIQSIPLRRGNILQIGLIEEKENFFFSEVPANLSSHFIGSGWLMCPYVNNHCGQNMKDVDWFKTIRSSGLGKLHSNYM